MTLLITHTRSALFPFLSSSPHLLQSLAVDSCIQDDLESFPAADVVQKKGADGQAADGKRPKRFINSSLGPHARVAGA